VQQLDMPATSRLMLIGLGSSGWRREKASRRWVRIAARSAPLAAFSATRRSRAASSGRLRCRISRLPLTI
jgi:hypothetical protein